MKRLNKSSISSLICVIVMLFSLCMILGVKSEAAAKKPSITKSVTIFRNSGTRIIGVDNMKKGDKITKVYPKNNDYNAIGAWTGERSDEIMISALNVSKTGSTKVYVKVQRGKKTYKLSMKVNVIPYTCPMQSAKIGKTNVKKAITNTADAFLKKNCSGKLSIKMKKGWTITEISQFVNGKSVKLKNNKKVSTKKGRIFITVKNKKTNQIEALSLAAGY